MRKELYQAGIVAIPLKKNDISLGNLHPNFIVFEATYSNYRTFSPNLQTGIPEMTSCIEVAFKIVHREILIQIDNKPEEFLERTILPMEALGMPINILPIIFTHSAIKENLAIVNLALSRFSFRGVLSNLVLEVDEDILDEIIAQENAENEPQPE